MPTANDNSTAATGGETAQGLTEAGANAQTPGSTETATTETTTPASTVTTVATAPETYEFKLTEGVTLDASVQEIAVPLFRELNLPQEGAQKVVDVYQKITALIDKRSAEAHQTMVADWQKQGRADKDYGGAKYEKSISESQALVARYGDAEFKTFLADTGLGNHPGLLRLLANIGKHFSEANVIPPAGNSGGGKVPLEDLLWAKKS